MMGAHTVEQRPNGVQGRIDRSCVSREAAREEQFTKWTVRGCV